MALSETPKTDWVPADGITNDDLNKIEQNTQDLENTKIEEVSSPVAGNLVKQKVDGQLENAGINADNPVFNSVNIGAGLIKEKIFATGAWNMVANPNIAFTTTTLGLVGLPVANVISLDAIVVNDSGAVVDSIYAYGGGSASYNAGTALFLIDRVSGGKFDGTNYDDAVINRAYLIIRYISY